MKPIQNNVLKGKVDLKYKIQSLLAPLPMKKTVRENINHKIQGYESLQKLRDYIIVYLHPWHAVELCTHFRVTLLAATIKITDIKGTSITSSQRNSGSQGFWGLDELHKATWVYFSKLVSIFFTCLAERCLAVRLQECFVDDKTSPDVSVSVAVSRLRLSFKFWMDGSFKIDAGGIQLQLVEMTFLWGIFLKK